MATLTIKQVHKSFGEVRVLHALDLEIADGEFLVLVGPSGCGKSTLLRCIAGLEQPSGGEICIDGRVVNEVAPKDRNVAMVFQSYALYPHMTVRENMGFSLSLQRRPASEIAAAVGAAAEMLNLGGLLDRRPSELSGGQRQRVAMGRAVVRRPAVFLFDEPLSNLDAALRTQLRLELKRLHKELGTTMVYVTHDQVEAMTLADRIAVLDGGHLQQVDEPIRVFDSPNNRFVAGFIGSPSMAFLTDLEPGVVLGVRPHQVRIGTGPLTAEVDVVEHLGTESYVHLRLGKERLVARVPSGEQPEGTVQVAIDSPLRFDPDSGLRLQVPS
jgi:ABC-type sugar transport system ATPase subunit